MDSILTTQFLGPTEISRNKAMSTAPSQYWPGWTTVSKLHNFSDRKGTGSLTTIWPLAPWITICPHQIFIPSAGTVLVVKRRRSSVCRLAPEGSTLLYVCMHMYLCMYVYVVVPGGCTKVRYLMSACQVKISSLLYSTYESIFVLQPKLYLLQIQEE